MRIMSHILHIMFTSIHDFLLKLSFLFKNSFICWCKTKENHIIKWCTILWYCIILRYNSCTMFYCASLKFRQCYITYHWTFSDPYKDLFYNNYSLHFPLRDILQWRKFIKGPSIPMWLLRMICWQVILHK